MTPDPDRVCWVDGAVLPRDKAVVRADDSSFTEGRGCYTSIRIRGGEPRFLARHLRRLRDGAAALGLGLFLVGTAPVFGQRPDRPSSRGARDSSIAGLKVGDRAPDVQVYDEKGKAHAFRDVLKGHTTALIFGCLT